MKSFLIIENQHQGHYLTGYIKYILRALPKKEFRVILLTTKKAKKYGTGALDILRKENLKIIIETISDVKPTKYTLFSLFIYQIKLYFLIRKKFNKIHKKYKFSHVFINSFQHFDKAFSILGSPFKEVKFSGVFLGIKYHLFDKFLYNFLNKFLFKILISNKRLLSLIINDELLFNFLKKKKWKYNHKIKFLHDPKEFNYKFNKILARSRLNLPNKSFLVLAYGAIIDSKGLKELISIFDNNDINPNTKVVIAGELIGHMLLYFKSPEVRKLINTKKLFVFNGWQTEISESLLFSASDVVWIGYKDYLSPSGVLYQAVCKNLPIITSNSHLVHFTNFKYKLGFSVNINDTNDIVFKLNRLQNKYLYKSFQCNIKSFSKIVSSLNWVNSYKRILSDYT